MARRIVDSDEHDVHTGWRHVMVRYTRAGNAAKVKKRTNRRERREGRDEIRHTDREG